MSGKKVRDEDYDVEFKHSRQTATVPPDAKEWLSSQVNEQARLIAELETANERLALDSMAAIEEVGDLRLEVEELNRALSAEHQEKVDMVYDLETVTNKLRRKVETEAARYEAALAVVEAFASGFSRRG